MHRSTISSPQEVETSPDGRYIRFDERLGNGAYKEVYLSYDTETGKEVAWNTVELKRLPDREKQRIRLETEILGSLNHPHIINFYQVWESANSDQICFATEIVTSGTLKQYTMRVKNIKLKVIKKWCRQILRGLHYLHSHDPPIIHRDLKCDNIFINGSTGEIRIGDFGLSAARHSTHVASVLGTPEFMAPELYDENYGEGVDIYAFGMCVLEMVSKEYPFEECANAAQIWKKVISGQKPGVLTRIHDTSLRSFIELCLNSQEMRLSAEELLAHPFLAFKRSDPGREAMAVVVDPKHCKTSLDKSADKSTAGVKDSTVSSPVSQQASRATSNMVHVPQPGYANATLVRPVMINTKANCILSPPSIPYFDPTFITSPIGAPETAPAAFSPVTSPAVSPTPTNFPLYINPNIMQHAMSPTSAQSPSGMGLNTSPMDGKVYHGVSGILVDIDQYEPCSRFVQILLHIQLDSRRKKQIKFQYDFQSDSSSALAAEMVKALKLPDPDRTIYLIASTLEAKVDSLRRLYLDPSRILETTLPASPSAPGASATVSSHMHSDLDALVRQQLQNSIGGSGSSSPSTHNCTSPFLSSEPPLLRSSTAAQPAVHSTPNHVRSNTVAHQPAIRKPLQPNIHIRAPSPLSVSINNPPKLSTTPDSRMYSKEFGVKSTSPSSLSPKKDYSSLPPLANVQNLNSLPLQHVTSAPACPSTPTQLPSSKGSRYRPNHVRRSSIAGTTMYVPSSRSLSTSPSTTPPQSTTPVRNSALDIDFFSDLFDNGNFFNYRPSCSKEGSGVYGRRLSCPETSPSSSVYSSMSDSLSPTGTAAILPIDDADRHRAVWLPHLRSMNCATLKEKVRAHGGEKGLRLGMDKRELVDLCYELLRSDEWPPVSASQDSAPLASQYESDPKRESNPKLPCALVS